MQDNKIIKVKEEDISMLHFLVVILKHKKMILCITFVFALITSVISLLMTPIYKAETKILPPQQSSSGISAQMLGQFGSSAGLSSGASGLIGSSLGISNKNDQYVGMLKSRTMYDYIINRFELMEAYKAKYIEDVRARLEGSVTVKNGKDDIISVSIEDKDPQMAADIANAFIEKLKDMTKTFAMTEASKRRLFFEEQLVQIKEDLIKAEEAMQGLQERTGALDMDEQAKVVIASIAELRTQIAAKEVELKVMKTYTESRNPDLQKFEEALKGMKEELQKLEIKNGETPDPLMPLGRFPKTGVEYARKLRDLKFQETLYDLMEKQYEIACIDEARDAIIIQVLDPAMAPVRKTKPKRAFMVAAATFSGFVLAIFAVIIMESLRNLSSDEKNRKMMELIRKYSFHKWGN